MRTITNKPVVAVSHLSFSRPNLNIFEGLNLEIFQGEHVSLLGSNGSGKSTLFELLIGTLRPSAGKITLATKKLAFVPQRTAFNERMPMTVRDTVEMGRWSSRGIFKRLTAKDHKIVDEQLERMGITALSKKELSELSGGQRQRALIAQALAQEASIILLDEPEAGLDAEASGFINRVLKEEAENGKTVIVATHDRTTAQNSERCILLSRKHLGIAADGKPSEILNDHILARTFD